MIVVIPAPEHTRSRISKTPRFFADFTPQCMSHAPKFQHASILLHSYYAAKHPKNYYLSSRGPQWPEISYKIFGISTEILKSHLIGILKSLES